MLTGSNPCAVQYEKNLLGPCCSQRCCGRCQLPRTKGPQSRRLLSSTVCPVRSAPIRLGAELVARRLTNSVLSIRVGRGRGQFVERARKRRRCPEISGRGGVAGLVARWKMGGFQFQPRREMVRPV